MKCSYLNSVRVVILTAWLLIAGGCERSYKMNGFRPKTTVEKLKSNNLAEQLQGLEEANTKFGGGR